MLKGELLPDKFCGLNSLSLGKTNFPVPEASNEKIPQSFVSIEHHEVKPCNRDINKDM